MSKTPYFDEYERNRLEKESRIKTSSTTRSLRNYCSEYVTYFRHPPASGTGFGYDYTSPYISSCYWQPDDLPQRTNSTTEPETASEVSRRSQLEFTDYWGFPIDQNGFPLPLM
jgi:hypothetical protein